MYFHDPYKYKSEHILNKNNQKFNSNYSLLIMNKCLALELHEIFEYGRLINPNNNSNTLTIST